MEEERIDVLVLQETHVNGNGHERKEKYTWYFSGKEESEGREYGGVARVIKNKLNKIGNLLDVVNEAYFIISCCDDGI